MADVQFFAVLQFKPAVFRDAILVTASGSDANRDHVLRRELHRLKGPLVHVRTDDSVTMAGVDQHPGRLDAEFLFDPRTNLRQIVVLDVPDLTDRDGIERDDHRCCRVALDDERLHPQPIIHGAGIDVGDVDFGDSRREVRRRSSARRE